MEGMAMIIAVIAVIIAIVAMGQANKANRRLNEIEGRYIKQLERQAERVSRDVASDHKPGVA